MSYHVSYILSDSHAFCSVIKTPTFLPKYQTISVFLPRILLLLTKFYFIEDMENYNVLTKNKKLIYHYYIIYHIYLSLLYYNRVFPNHILKQITETHGKSFLAIFLNFIPCGPSGGWIAKCWEVCVWSNFKVLLLYNSPRNIYVQTFGFTFVKLCSNTIFSFSK